ncbi:MAG TPA: cytochrome c [Gammaproteobacteria bacterium]|nr:cytochrome c [Gammaproteobacteria bacterium]
MKQLFSSLIILALVGFIAGVAFAFSGMFNVATSWEDPQLMKWLMVTTREYSIESRAKSITAPELGSKEQIENGYRGFRDMCVICHNLPGTDASPVAQGLSPEPPDLAEEADHMSAAELFWVTKNGIRMTGMPAWGPTHDDTELWEVIAFIKAMPELSKADYRKLEQHATTGNSHDDNHQTNNANDRHPADHN